MKSLEKIELILFDELLSKLNSIKLNVLKEGYYNKLMGDTSFLLAKLLEYHLKLRKDWDSNKWLDDSLLTRVELDGNKISISGLMIWGIKNTTEQWVDPFCFEAELNKTKTDFKKYTISFEDLNKPEILYQESKINPKCLILSKVNWKYLIKR